MSEESTSSKKDWKKFKEDQAQDSLVTESSESEPQPSALSHASYLELEEKLTLVEQQSHENWEKSVRALAELDNVRRRAERDVSNAHRYSLEKFAGALLPVVDSLEQALQLAHQSNDAGMTEGLELTMQLFVGVLTKFEVKQLNPVGEAFDPQQHEAMSMQVSPDAAPNTVLMVFQKGYTLNDRVIRPARVVVSKEISS
jgi:molecular chaperone GrpE